MSKKLKKDILINQEELKPFLSALYNCNDEQMLGCVAKPSPKKPTLKKHKRCPKGTRRNKKTGNCDPVTLKVKKRDDEKTQPRPKTPSPKTPSPKKPTPKKPSPKKPTLKKHKRCPKGTRKNKKTGNCDPIGLKTKSPKDVDKLVLTHRDVLYTIIRERSKNSWNKVFNY